MGDRRHESRTRRIILDSMNSILDFLTFTLESPSDFPDGKLPTLDINVWIEAMEIWYQFFQKPMSNNVVLQEKTALSDNVKLSSLTEEVVRRLKHTRYELPDSYRMDTLEDLSQRMSNSGHKPLYTKRILATGIAKFERMVRNSLLDETDKEYKPLHQPSGRCKLRMKKKAMAKENWFRGKEKSEDEKQAHISPKDGKPLKTKTAQKNLQATTVMFLPNTKGGILLKKMKENEEKLAAMTGFKVSYTETAGTKLGRIFSLDLAKDQPCGRPVEKCSQCNTWGEGKPNCKARCITYESRCTVCNPDNPNSKPTVSNHQEGETPPTSHDEKKVEADP